MRLKDKIRDYKLRHLSLGKVKNLDKEKFGNFRIEKISWDVSWQTNLYLAVIIRDYLRFFIQNTMAIGNCVIDDETFLSGSTGEDKSELYWQKWKELVNSVADEFDELIKMMLTDSSEIEDYQVFNKEQKALEKKAFSELAEIFDDLEW